MMIEFSKEVRESKEMNEICQRVLDRLDKPKGRPKNTNKNIRFSCTLTPAQLDWLNKTADEMGIERSAVLRMAVDKMMFEEKIWND